MPQDKNNTERNNFVVTQSHTVHEYCLKPSPQPPVDNIHLHIRHDQHHESQ